MMDFKWYITDDEKTEQFKKVFKEIRGYDPDPIFLTLQSDESCFTAFLVKDYSDIYLYFLAKDILIQYDRYDDEDCKKVSELKDLGIIKNCEIDLIRRLNSIFEHDADCIVYFI